MMGPSVSPTELTVEASDEIAVGLGDGKGRPHGQRTLADEHVELEAVREHQASCTAIVLSCASPQARASGEQATDFVGIRQRRVEAREPVLDGEGAVSRR